MFDGSWLKGLWISGTSVEVEPENEAYAPWTHFRANAQGTGVSADQVVAPSNSFRWFHQNFPGAQLRTTDGVVGYLLYSLSGVRIAKTRKHLTQYHGIEAYDAFSGVPLWHKKDQQATYNRIREGFVSHELGFIHLQPGVGQPAALTDHRTGELLVVYDQGLTFGLDRSIVTDRDAFAKAMGADQSIKRVRKGGRPNSDKTMVMLVHEQTYIQVYGPNVVALDIATGDKLWQYRLQNGGFLASVSDDGQRLYVCESSNLGRLLVAGVVCDQSHSRIEYARWL